MQSWNTRETAPRRTQQSQRQQPEQEALLCMLLYLLKILPLRPREARSFFGGLESAGPGMRGSCRGPTSGGAPRGPRDTSTSARGKSVALSSAGARRGARFRDLPGAARGAAQAEEEHKAPGCERKHSSCRASGVCGGGARGGGHRHGADRIGTQERAVVCGGGAVLAPGGSDARGPRVARGVPLIPGLSRAGHRATLGSFLRLSAPHGTASVAGSSSGRDLRDAPVSDWGGEWRGDGPEHVRVEGRHRARGLPESEQARRCGVSPGYRGARPEALSSSLRVQVLQVQHGHRRRPLTANSKLRWRRQEGCVRWQAGLGRQDLIVGPQ